MSSIKLASEELERLISLCETIAKTGADPYAVDVKSMLSKLRQFLEKADSAELLVLDAETLYRIALVIALQHKWLKDRASSLFVDSQMISLKIMAADKRSLAQAFAQCWRPIVSTEQITLGMVSKGLEYFLSLPSRGPKTSVLSDELSGVDFSQMIDVVRDRQAVEDELKTMHKEMLEMCGGNGLVNYVKFISKDGPVKIIDRAYLTAFIVSEGLADALKNPLTGEIYLKPYEKKTERKNISSMVVVFKDGEVHG